MKAGIIHPISLFNASSRDQLHYNWLRFNNNQPELRCNKAQLYWLLKKHYLDTGKFDIGQLYTQGCHCEQ